MSDNNVVPIRGDVTPLELPAHRIAKQIAWLRALCDQAELDPGGIDRLAFAVLARFPDGSRLVQCSGFNSDSEAQRYFDTVMRGGRLDFTP